jgi:hypothetical protein
MEHQSIEKMRTALETQSLLPVIRAVKKKSVENEVHFVWQTRVKRVDYFPFWRVRFVLKKNYCNFQFFKFALTSDWKFGSNEEACSVNIRRLTWRS